MFLEVCSDHPNQVVNHEHIETKQYKKKTRTSICLNMQKNPEEDLSYLKGSLWGAKRFVYSSKSPSQDLFPGDLFVVIEISKPRVTVLSSRGVLTTISLGVLKYPNGEAGAVFIQNQSDFYFLDHS